MCAERAGISLGTYAPAINGQVIEQQLILTTHNLAATASLPGAREVLAGRWHELARRCFDWVLQHLQLPEAGYHVALHRLKNAAYAWRQMVFFLSLEDEKTNRFLQWAEERLREQPTEFRRRFQPAVVGLAPKRQVVPTRWTIREPLARRRSNAKEHVQLNTSISLTTHYVVFSPTH